MFLLDNRQISNMIIFFVENIGSDGKGIAFGRRSTEEATNVIGIQHERLERGDTTTSSDRWAIGAGKSRIEKCTSRTYS